MSSLPLHTKYRPENFDTFIGNDSVVSSLNTILSRLEGQPRTFLFQGPSGCGKTTLARIMKNILNCSDDDFHEFNTANTRGIDTIREIKSTSEYKPWLGKVKIYLLDEVHKLTNDAQNAVLKLLEDTPEHVRFILCTTDPEKLLKTIRTRCTTFQLSALPKRSIIKLLRDVCTNEQVLIDKGFEKVLEEIARVSEGLPRKALVLLDQVIDLNDEDALKAIEKVTLNESTTLELCQLLIESVPNKWERVATILKGLDTEPETVRYAILGYLAVVLLNKGDVRVAQMISIFSESFMYSGKAGLIAACFLACRD
jgi:DNA polymerase-3 subunit gamma/tau